MHANLLANSDLRLYRSIVYGKSKRQGHVEQLLAAARREGIQIRGETPAERSSTIKRRCGPHRSVVIKLGTPESESTPQSCTGRFNDTGTDEECVETNPRNETVGEGQTTRTWSRYFFLSAIILPGGSP